MKTIPQISVDSQTLYRRLIQASVGEVITYDELTALIGRNVRPKEKGYANLYTAKKRALNENQIVFGPVQGVGIKRLDDAETVSASRCHLHKSRTAARYSRRIAATVDPKNLTAEDRALYEATSLTAATIDLVTKPSKQKALETRIKTSDKPPVAEVLRMFAAGE